MLAPLCPECDTRHWPRQGCPARKEKKSGPEGKSPSTSAAPADMSLKASPAPASVPSASSRGNADVISPAPPNVQPADTSTSGGPTTITAKDVVGVASGPLTPAEKQERWRKNNPEKYAADNKARNLRRKRK